MSDETPRSSRDEAYWQDFLTHPDSFMGFGRRVLGRIPASPRCRLCAAPFAGPGGPVMRMIGKGPSAANPTVCSACQNVLMRHHGGAEVDSSMLFADIRGSTAMAETMSPAAFRERLDRFYTTATNVVVGHDGMVDKFVGDELVAVFPPMLSDVPHAERAVDAATALLEQTGHADEGGPWVPLGAACTRAECGSARSAKGAMSRSRSSAMP
jgi:adenylate cyclase